MADRTITDLAEAVSDGDLVDWRAARDRLASSKDHSLAEGLEVLSRLTIPPASTSPARSSRDLPWLLRAARVVSVLCCLMGIVGGLELLQSPQSRGVGVRLLALLSFAGAALFLDLGGVDRRARALAVCYWTIAASFSMRGALFLAQQFENTSWLWQLAGAMRPESFFAATVWQFARDFPVLNRFSRVDSVCVAALRVTLGMGLTLFVVNLLPAVAPDTWIVAWTAPLLRATGFDPWFWNLVFTASLPALGVIALRGSWESGAEKTRIRLFLYAICLCIGPIVVEVIAEGVFPAYARIINTPRGLWWGSIALYPPLLALPILTAYAVHIENVLEVRVVIQQGLRYLLARWLITAGALVPLVALLGYLYLQRDRPLTQIVDATGVRILIVVAAVASLTLMYRTRLLGLLDRWVFPTGEDPSAMLAQMSDRMKEMRTPLEVTSLFARAAERTLHAPATAYLFRSGRLVPTRDGDAPPPSRSILPVLLEGGGEPCVLAPRHRHSYHGLLTDEDRRWIAEQDICVVVPVHGGRQQKGLLGAISLKSRRNAIAFSQDDLRFLRAGSAAASLACDVLQAEAGPASLATGTGPDEVGIQCVRCGRVEAWSSVDHECPCGGVWEPAVVPKRFAGRLEVTHKLGAGGMGVVYRAVDLTLKRDVAIKTLPSLSEEAAVRLREEAQTMAALSHAHTAVLYGTETWHSTPILVMEFLPGGTLASRLRQGRLTFSTAVEILRALTPALRRMHGSGLYHGDIKPSNIGFTADDVPKFLDFGLSRAVGFLHADGPAERPRQRGQRPAAGTLPYLSPEVREGAAAGPALDIWAMCVVLCESVLGVNPFLDARTTSDMDRALSLAIAQLRPHGGQTLCDFLGRALRTDTARRPTTATDLLEQLNALASEQRSRA